VRRTLLVVLSLFALQPVGAATAYPWPIKPFHKQHPIRANFGDPRTRFWNTMLTDGLDGPGLFQFHKASTSPPRGGPPCIRSSRGRHG